jgi:hypothetical protein
MFGWKLDYPVVIIIRVKEHKLVNFMEAKELSTLGFVQMLLRRTLDYSFSNGGTKNSYGCNDYMPKLFNNYLEDIIIQDKDCNDQEEINSLGLAISNEE